MYNAKIVYENGNTDIVTCKENITDDYVEVSILADSVAENVKYIDLCYDLFTATVNEDGYYLYTRGTAEGGTVLTYFNQKEDEEYIGDGNQLPLFGVKNGDSTKMVLMCGMKYEHLVVVGVKNGEYYIFPRFYIDKEMLYEDISIRIYNLPKGSGYNEMAHLYRSIKLNEGCVPIKDRLTPELKYATESVELRVRLAWKPVPTPVEHQTVENEPPMIAACTFERVLDVAKALKAHNVGKIDINFVGWNIKGHDGRDPQLFPVEEALGGEEELRRVVKEIQELGYSVTCHTNSSDAYEIADIFSEDLIIKDKQGNVETDINCWSGGLPYHLCPQKAYEIAGEILPKVADMGFKGIHYIDVLSVVPPRKCYDKNHFLNSKQSVEYQNKLMKMTRDLFGGFSSEGGFDHCAQNLDYVLYTTYNIDGGMSGLCDKVIPFWQLVYHGIILYNPATCTINYKIKDKHSQLKFIEYGGRPSAYIYSKYVGEGAMGNWMGEEDLLCANDEQLNESAKTIASMWQEYEDVSYLQYEFMDRHEEVEPNVFEITYSDGTVVTVDYNKEKYTIKKNEKIIECEVK